MNSFHKYFCRDLSISLSLHYLKDAKLLDPLFLALQKLASFSSLSSTTKYINEQISNS